MKFKNTNEDVQVRIKEKSIFGGEGCRWKCVHHNQEVELDEVVGVANGFEIVNEAVKNSNDTVNDTVKVTEGKAGETKVETKQFDKKKDYQIKLEKINGIGKKTAKDILKIFPTEEKLIEAISNGYGLPVRDDIEIILRREYGK